MSKRDTEDLLQYTIKKDGEYQKQLIECIELKNKEIERLNDLLEGEHKVNQMYLNNIIKAIEYINKFDDISAYYEYIDEDGCNEYFDVDFKKDMLDILKGVDKE